MSTRPTLLNAGSLLQSALGRSVLAQSLSRHRSLCGAVFFLAFAAGIAIALLTKPTYRAEALISVIENDSIPSSLSAIAGRLGEIGPLLGLGAAGQQETETAIALLGSKELLADFVTDLNLLPILFADQWDPARKSWRDSDPTEAPSLDKGIKFLREKVLAISRDKSTGLVTVSVYWTDPELAASWANGLIAKADSVLRAIAIEQATKSKQYLDDELAKTSTLEVRESMYRLIEAQVQTIMLAQVRENYAFKVIDKARVPDRDDYVRPRRLIIVLAGAVLGLMLAGALGLLLDSGAGSQRPADST
jgi:uncharacterized protein involved in exopolysaccharide biosynthesis